MHEPLIEEDRVSRLELRPRHGGLPRELGNHLSAMTKSIGRSLRVGSIECIRRGRMSSPGAVDPQDVTATQTLTVRVVSPAT